MKSFFYLTLCAASLCIPPGAANSADFGDLTAWFSFERMKGVAPVNNEQYQEECGSCHFAYPTGLLPERSWRKLLAADQLADHFGENAELEEEVRAKLEAYALSNAADNSLFKRSRKVMAATPDESTPMRITEVRYIRRKHDKIPTELVKGNPEVLSLSYCNACHTKAEEGIFDDDTVFIKGHGPWDDD